MAWDTSTRARRLPKDWPKLRAAVLKRDSTCRLRYDCCTVVGTEVDHVIPNDDHRLSNLQGVCAPCHKQKTQQESQQARGVGASRKRSPLPHPGLTGGG